MKPILNVLGPISDESKWPLSIDLSNLVTKIPELQELHRKREEAVNVKKGTRRESKV